MKLVSIFAAIRVSQHKFLFFHLSFLFHLSNSAAYFKIAQKNSSVAFNAAVKIVSCPFRFANGAKQGFQYVTLLFSAALVPSSKNPKIGGYICY